MRVGTIPARMVRRVSIALALELTALACSEPGTSTDPRPVAAGQVVDADLARGVRTRFVFETSAPAFTVYFQATTGSATIVVSLRGAELVRHTSVTASTDPLEHHLVGQVNTTAPSSFDVELTGAGHARFELIELAPTPAPPGR